MVGNSVFPLEFCGKLPWIYEKINVYAEFYGEFYKNKEKICLTEIPGHPNFLDFSDFWILKIQGVQVFEKFCF